MFRLAKRTSTFLPPIQFEIWDAKPLEFPKVFVSFRVFTRILPLHDFPIGCHVAIYTLGRNAEPFPSAVFDHFRQVDLILLQVSDFSIEFLDCCKAYNRIILTISSGASLQKFDERIAVDEVSSDFS